MTVIELRDLLDTVIANGLGDSEVCWLADGWMSRTIDKHTLGTEWDDNNHRVYLHD